MCDYNIHALLSIIYKPVLHNYTSKYVCLHKYYFAILFSGTYVVFDENNYGQIRFGRTNLFRNSFLLLKFTKFTIYYVRGVPTHAQI